MTTDPTKIKPLKVDPVPVLSDDQSAPLTPAQQQLASKPTRNLTVPEPPKDSVSAIEKPPLVPIKPTVYYKIDKLEGQFAKKWFTRDFGAQHTITIRPKLVNESSMIKGRLVAFE